MSSNASSIPAASVPVIASGSAIPDSTASARSDTIEISAELREGDDTQDPLLDPLIAAFYDLEIDLSPPGEDIYSLTKSMIAEIQQDISVTKRPTWQQTPTIGKAGHGKLKADEWRTLMEFDLPVSLVKIWTRKSADTHGPGNQDFRKLQFKKLIANTMSLATAVIWGTSRRTSAKHAEKYTKHMKAYLASLMDLFPSHKLVPNHHWALHIGPILLKMGPVPAYWAYFGERLIRILQHANTNSKPGA